MLSILHKLTKIIKQYIFQVSEAANDRG